MGKQVWAPVYMAAYKGLYTSCQLLIEIGADVNNVGKNKSVLYMATFDGRLDICKMLVEHGADVNYV